MSPTLLILDCDGVLVDSEGLSAGVLAATLAPLGWTVTAAEAARRFRGRRLPEILAELAPELSVPLPPTIMDTLRDGARRALATVRPIPGVIEALDRIALPDCVASGGSPAKLRLTLGASGLLDRFAGRLFSSFDVDSFKPDPGLFLHAARSLGHAPECCVVVEDSVVGVQAGRAAGMRVLGYAADDDGADLRAAGAEVFHTMAALPGLVSG